MSLWKELQMKPSPAHYAPPLEADLDPVSSAKTAFLKGPCNPGDFIKHSGQGLLGRVPVSLSLGLLLRVHM